MEQLTPGGASPDSAGAAAAHEGAAPASEMTKEPDAPEEDGNTKAPAPEEQPTPPATPIGDPDSDPPAIEEPPVIAEMRQPLRGVIAMLEKMARTAELARDWDRFNKLHQLTSAFMRLRECVADLGDLKFEGELGVFIDGCRGAAACL